MPTPTIGDTVAFHHDADTSVLATITAVRSDGTVDIAFADSLIIDGIDHGNSAHAVLVSDSGAPGTATSLGVVMTGADAPVTPDAVPDAVEEATGEHEAGVEEVK